MKLPPTPSFVSPFAAAVSALVAPLLVSSALLAQSAPPATPTAADEPADAATAAGDEVVVLGEFNVTTTAPSEYSAAESTTGTRVATKIRDLPFAVNTVTGEFLDDFAAFEFREQFGYTSSVSVWETLSTGYTLRGFDADVQLRNGFRRIGLIDKVNVERAEVIKGPAASIYGTVLPGGTINVITKKPKTKAEQRIALTAGSNNLLRAQASSTGPVGSSNQFFYRVDLAADKNDYDQAFKAKEQQTVAAQLLWKPARDTSLLIELEWLERSEVGISSATVPFLIQTNAVDPHRRPTSAGAPRTFVRYTGLAVDEAFNFNNQGPLNYSDRYVHNATATFEHRFNDVFSLRSSANWFDRGLERQEVGGRDQFNPTTGTAGQSFTTNVTNTAGNRGGVPRLRPFGEGGMSWQTDLLAAWETSALQHKTLLTLDYQRQSETPERYDLTNFVLGLPDSVRRNGVSVTTPDYAFVTYHEDPALYAMNQKEDNSIDLYGIFLSERITAFGDRLHLLGGMRYDYVDNHSRDLRAGVTSERQTDEISYQVGGGFRVLPALTVFGNTARSFVPQFAIGRNLDGSTFELPNEFGESWEVGLKAGFFADKLTFTTTYFDIQRNNVARDTTDPTTGTSITVLSGVEAAKGYEFDFNWVVTEELQFFGGYGYVDSEVVSNAQARFLEGTPIRRTPQDNLGIGTKFNFKRGPLQGLYLTAGYKYYGRSLVNPSTGRNITRASVTASNPFVNAPMSNGLLPFPQFEANAILTSIPSDVRVDDGRDRIFNESYSVVEAGVGYSWKTGGRRVTHKVQANVSNLLDEVYTYGSAGQGQGTGVVFTYDLRF